MGSRRTIRALLLILACVTLLTGCERARSWLSGGDYCVLSERRIHPGMAVRVEVDDGPSGQACCLRCAITYSRQTGKTVWVDWVTDHASGRETPPDRAVYVVGSDVAPCAAKREVATASRRELLTEMWDRCRTSTIAFADPADARAFHAEHGGVIRTFAEVVGKEKVRPGRSRSDLSGDR
jgi:hypothetical protein